jgi:hypothetical protein
MGGVLKVEVRLNGHLRDIASTSMEGPELETIRQLPYDR